MKTNLVLFLGIAAAISCVFGMPSLAYTPGDPSEPVVPGSSVGALNPIGIWQKKENAPKFEIFKCGKSHCGKIVYLNNPIDPETGKPVRDKSNPDESKRNRPLLGTLVLLNMQPVGPNQYKGRVYEPESGRYFSGTLSQISSNVIKMGGCILGGLICKTDTLVRVK